VAGDKTGAGTHTRKYWDELRAGNITPDDWIDLESRMTRSIGTCNTMGTATTMTSIVDAMGMTLTGASSIRRRSGHTRMASACGERIVAMVAEDLRPSKILTPAAFANGVVAYMALGGSTKRRHPPDRHGRARRRQADPGRPSPPSPPASGLRQPVPVRRRADGGLLLRGGLRALLAKLSAHLDLTAITVEGRTLGEAIAGPNASTTMCQAEDNPVTPLSRGSTLALLRGNLCPDGAVMKSSAAIRGS